MSSPKDILRRNWIVYIPAICCGLFILLITWASIKYPGGSETHPCAMGYSWQHNYMCDITASVATNEIVNAYSLLALTAMSILTVGLAFLFYHLPSWLVIKGMWSILIRWLGILCMFAAMLIFTPLHNVMIGVASILGMLPLVGTFLYLKKRGLLFLYFYGIFSILLLAINNIIYYSEIGKDYLPVIQKVSFLVIILWIIMINVRALQYYHSEASTL